MPLALAIVAKVCSFRQNHFHMDVEIQTVRFENLKYRVSSDLEMCQL